MQFRNLVRRQKWRLRPLKRLVLPLRNLRRALVRMRRKPPRVILATEYRGSSFVSAHKVHPAWVVQPLPNPARTRTRAMNSSQDAWLYEFRNIDFWARYGGSVTTADNFLLADLSPDVFGPANHPIYSRLRLPAAKLLRGRTGIAVTPEAPGNYYHWLIDLLPRVALLNKNDDFHSCDRVLLNGSQASYESESLRALGLHTGKVQYVTTEDRFQVEQATMASMDHDWKVIGPWKVDVLRKVRETIPPPSAGTSRRLYISRRRAAVRRVLNENELESLLADHGFTMIELEDCSWTDQVALFGAAEAVIAPHGAALANIAFCKPGAIVAEICTRAGFREFFLQLAASAGLSYHFLEAAPRTTAKGSSVRAAENEDMALERESLQNLLRSLSKSN